MKGRGVHQKFSHANDKLHSHDIDNFCSVFDIAVALRHGPTFVGVANFTRQALPCGKWRFLNHQRHGLACMSCSACVACCTKWGPSCNLTRQPDTQQCGRARPCISKHKTRLQQHGHECAASKAAVCMCGRCVQRTSSRSCCSSCYCGMQLPRDPSQSGSSMASWRWWSRRPRAMAC